MSLSPHYIIVVDKQRDVLLGCLVDAALKNPIGAAVFDMLCRQNKISPEEVNSFLQEMADKTHEMDWCDDPNCKYKKKKV